MHQKNNHKSHLLGFTLAEMVLAMAIVAILTAAMVPMLKYHKVRPKENFTPHGLIECYYDDSGKLHMYEKDNDKNVMGTDTTFQNAQSCEISVPKANYYELHVIGAGGPGGGYNDEEREKILAGTELVYQNGDSSLKTATLNISSSFKSQVASLNKFVRDTWAQSERAAQIAFSIVPPRGKGGTESEPKLKNFYIVQDDGSVVIEQRWVTEKYGYGNEAPNEFTTPYYQIKPTTTIENASLPSVYPITAEAILSIDGTPIITASSTVATGGTTKSRTGFCEGKKNEDSCGNKITITGGGATEPYAKPTTTSESGSMTSAPIVFKYRLVNLNYKYGESGAEGVYAKTYYEKIRSNKLKFTPAYPAEGIEHSVVEMIFTKASGNTVKTLYTTKEKKNFGATDDYKTLTEGSLSTFLVSNFQYSDLPIPNNFKSTWEEKSRPQDKELYADYCVHESPDRTVSKGMCQKIEDGDMKISPGMPGYGGYPLLYKLNDDISEVIMIDAVGEYVLSRMNLESSDSTECYDGDISGQTPTDYSYGKNQYKYCSGTQGFPGAIILLW